MSKRTRHRRALMRMLFDYYQTNRLIVCIDPSNLDLLQDFARDRSFTRILKIQCDFSDEYLTGHAKRVGLAGEQTPKETLERLLPTIRNEIQFESDAIRDADFECLYPLHENAALEDNAKALSQFLTISQEEAAEIIGDGALFKD